MHKLLISFILLIGFVEAGWVDSAKSWSKKAYSDTKTFSKKAGKGIVKSYQVTKEFIKKHPKEVAIGTVVTLTAIDIATGGTTLGLTAPTVTSSLATLGGGSMITGLATIGVGGLTVGYLLGKDTTEKNATVK
jgi:hypothetical protein